MNPNTLNTRMIDAKFQTDSEAQGFEKKSSQKMTTMTAEKTDDG